VFLLRLLKNSLSRRPLKKVQMQGGERKAERGVLQVRRNERLSEPTWEVGLIQRPAKV